MLWFSDANNAQTSNSVDGLHRLRDDAIKGNYSTKYRFSEESIGIYFVAVIGVIDTKVLWTIHMRERILS